MIIGKIKDNMQDTLKAYNLHFVSSPNSEKEISRLESDWKFKAGDEGFVHPVKYDRKLHFKPFPNGKYRTRVK